MKVLHLITRSVVGGSQDNTFCTARLHDRSRYEVHLACNPHGHWVDQARRAADIFHAIPALVAPIRPWKDWCAFLAIVRLLRRESFDLIHTHTAKAGFLGRLAAGLCGVPRVVHTYHAFPFHDHMSKWQRTLYIVLERLVCPLTDAFITVSERERQLGGSTRVLRPADSQTIYSGIDFEKIDRPCDLPSLRDQLRIPADHAVVLMAGRFDEQKAPHLMIQAFRKVADSHPRTMLLMVGDGPLRPQVEEAISQLALGKQVRLLGFRSDVPDLIKLADVFALSSLWEGLGRAMTEAMLLGKPVVVPDTNGIPEIVHHGRTGLLYPTGKIDELANGLLRLLNHPEERAQLGEQARTLTRSRFDLREMVNRIEELYDGLSQPGEELVAQPANSVCVPEPAEHFQSGT